MNTTANLHQPLTIANAPAASKPIMEGIQKSFRELVSKRGHASRATIDNFLAVGFTKTQVMELLMAVALKTISNYLDHINPAPLVSLFDDSKHFTDLTCI